MLLHIKGQEYFIKYLLQVKSSWWVV